MHVIGILRHFRRQRRPRADERHGAADHVEQLRQLVEAELAHDLADRRDPGVIRHLEQHLVARIALLAGEVLEHVFGVDDHRAELQHRELATAQADAGLSEQHRPLARQPHRDGEERQHRTQRDHPENTRDEIDHALQEQLALAEPRRLHVDEGETRDRARVQSGPGDVDDARREHEVLLAGFEAPRDLLDLVRRQVVGAGDGDRVGAGGGDRAIDGVDRAHDGDISACDRRGHRGVRNARSDDEIARGGRALQLVGDLGDRLRGADEQHPRGVLLHRPPCDQPVPPQPSLEHEHEHTRRETQQQVAAGDFDAQQERGDRDEAEERQARVRHPDVLGGAMADDAIAAGIDEGQCPHPCQHQSRREQPVRHRADPGVLMDREVDVAGAEPYQLCAEDHPDEHEQVAEPQPPRVVRAPARRRRRRGVRCVGRRGRRRSPLPGRTDGR